MRTLFIMATLCAVAAPALGSSSGATAHWLSQQLHTEIAASQIISAPAAAELEGCAVANTKPTQTGAIAVAVRCDAPRLPRLILLGQGAVQSTESSRPQPKPHASARTTTNQAQPMVRQGSLLEARWISASLRLHVPVVAIEAGNTGEEIRVRVRNANRILHARIVDAHTVTILSTEV